MKLTQKQARKVLKGGAIQLKPEQLSMDGLPADTPMRIQKQLKRAIRLSKGMRLKLEPEEMIEGSGFLDFIKSLGNMVLTPFRKLAPVLKPVAKAIAPVVAPIIASKTGIPITGDILEKGVDVVGNLAGVGMRRGGAAPRGRVSKQSVPKLQDNMSTMMGAQHPVFMQQPILPPMDMSRAVRKNLGVQSGAGVMFDSKQFMNPFTPVVANYTAGAGQKAGSFKLAKGMKRGRIQTAGSFKLN